MPKQKDKLIRNNKPSATEHDELNINDIVESNDESSVLPFSNATASLMPELEELVKKNPNRLIGCGG